MSARRLAASPATPTGPWPSTLIGCATQAGEEARTATARRSEGPLWVASPSRLAKPSTLSGISGSDGFLGLAALAKAVSAGRRTDDIRIVTNNTGEAAAAASALEPLALGGGHAAAVEVRLFAHVGLIEVGRGRLPDAPDRDHFGRRLVVDARPGALKAPWSHSGPRRRHPPDRHDQRKGIRKFQHGFTETMVCWRSSAATRPM